jgi:hypothetical protein
LTGFAGFRFYRVYRVYRVFGLHGGYKGDPFIFHFLYGGFDLTYPPIFDHCDSNGIKFVLFTFFIWKIWRFQNALCTSPRMADF